MGRQIRSESPSGTFGRRSLRRGSSTDDDGGEVVPSARVRSKQRQIDEVEEHLKESGGDSPSSLRSNPQGSSPSSELHHFQQRSSPTLGSKTPVHDSTDESQDASHSSAHLFRRRYGIGERGGADSIPPLTRTTSATGLEGERRQDAERARLLLNHAAESSDRSRLRRSDRDVSQSQFSIPLARVASSSSGSGDPTSDLWQALQGDQGGRASSARMDDVPSSKRQSAVSDSTTPTVLSQNGGRHQSLKFLTPTDEDLGRRRMSDASTLRPVLTEGRRARVRSVPTDVLRTMQRSESRQSVSPLTDTRRRHQSLQAPLVHLPLPPPLMLRSDSGPFARPFSQTSIHTDISLQTRSWRPSAATHFSDPQEAKDFIAHQRKVSDAYSAAVASLEPHLPKPAVGTSQADPFVSAPRSQSFASAIQRSLVPLRLVVPFLVTIFFDFNALFVLAELASQNDQVANTGGRSQAAWWIAFGIYALSTGLQLVVFSWLVTKAYIAQADQSRALAVPTFLSLYGRLLLIMRKESLQHFVRTVDKEATLSQRLTESAWRRRQAWPIEATQMPRLAIAIVYVILYSPQTDVNTNGLYSSRDPFFFDQSSGYLSRYSFAATLANIAWIGCNVLLVLLAALWVMTRNSSKGSNGDEVARWEEERTLSPASPAGPNAPRWQQDTRDRICLALLELERATSLDQMNRLPVHSTHGRSSRLGKGASLSGTALGSASPVSAQGSPDLHRSGVNHLAKGFDMVDAQQPRTSMSAGPEAAPILDLNFPTEDSYHRFVRGVSGDDEPRTPGPVPFPVPLHTANSSEDRGEEPSRSYLSHPLASAGSDSLAQPATLLAPVVLHDGDGDDSDSSSDVPSDPEDMRSGLPVVVVDPDHADVRSGEAQVDSAVAGNDAAKDRFPSWPRRLSLLRTANSLKHKKRLQSEEASSAAELEHYEASANGAPQDDEPHRFWSNWFGSRGRRRADATSQQHLDSLAQRDHHGSAAGSHDMVRIDSSEPTRRVVGFETPSRDEQASTPIASEQRLNVAAPQRHAQVITPTSFLGTEDSGRSSNSSDDSEERRLWATFPDQSRRHPPGLIALELQERARQEAEQRLAAGVEGQEAHEDDDLSLVAHSQQDLCMAPSLMSLISEQDPHTALVFARSPSEGGLMAIREESSTYGDGSSGTVRSGETLSRNHSLASTGGGRGGGIDRSGSESSEMTNSAAGPGGGGMSTSTSAASGLASVEEG